MSRPVRFLVLLLSTSVVLAMVLWGFQRRLLYLPGQAPAAIDTVLPAADAVDLVTDDGMTIAGWWLQGGATAAVVLPGNAGNRADRVPLAAALNGLGLSVLLVDYRGYGGNPGAPSELGLLTDGRAAVGWVEARPDVERVVLFGESLGAAVAIGVAHDHPPDAIVLRSPFTSVVEVARAHLGPVPEWMVRDRFDSLSLVRRVDVPLLVLATRQDEVVPFEQSRRLAAAASGPSRFVDLEATGHNDRALLDGDQLVAELRSFLDEHALLPDRRSPG